MHLDSLTPLLVITNVCVMGMLLLVGRQIHYTQKLFGLNNKNKSLLRLINRWKLIPHPIMPTQSPYSPGTSNNLCN
tara:strand:- start:17714 stop:17941 length:228 start_codon:yes stop_codon:yes gene_type:complete